MSLSKDGRRATPWTMLVQLVVLLALRERARQFDIEAARDGANLLGAHALGIEASGELFAFEDKARHRRAEPLIRDADLAHLFDLLLGDLKRVTEVSDRIAAVALLIGKALHVAPIEARQGGRDVMTEAKNDEH